MKTTNLSVFLVSISVSGEVNEKWNNNYTKILVVNGLLFVLLLTVVSSRSESEQDRQWAPPATTQRTTSEQHPAAIPEDVKISS
jgi:hypothetical protein